RPASQTNRGLIDLITPDPLIGNSNSFNNIENSLAKPPNGFTLVPAGTTTGTGTAGVDKVWTSPNTAGTGTGEPAITFDAGGGNDALYGRSNDTSPGAAGDTLHGGAGNNFVAGRAGNDVIDSAQSGSKYLGGRLVNDGLTGCSGD